MIWHIAKKEFRNNITTANFIASFILMMVLIPYTVITGVRMYESKQNTYHSDVKETEEHFDSRHCYAWLNPTAIKPPTPLNIFCTGISEQVGSSVTLNKQQKPLFARGITTMHENPFLNSFGSIDFVNILVILLSLMGVFFSYNLFSAEKEKGTLKLILSNNVSRAQFFSGKILGVYLTLLPILLISFLTIIVIIQFSPAVRLVADDYLRLLILIVLSLIYFSFFIFLGSFISSKVKASSTGLIINLMIWSILLFLLPNLGSYVGKISTPIDNYQIVNRSIADLDKELNNEYDEVKKQLVTEGLTNTGCMICMGSEYGSLMVFFTPTENMNRFRRNHELMGPKILENSDKKWRVQEDYLNKLYRQEKSVKYLSCFSPSEIFKHVAAGLCKVDRGTQIDFMDQARSYHDNFYQYYVDQNLFGSYSYFTPQKKEEFPSDFEDGMSKIEEWQKVAKPEHTFDMSSIPYLDTDEFPRFEYKNRTIGQTITDEIILLAGILLICVVLFWFTYTSFIKYDVR